MKFIQTRGGPILRGIQAEISGEALEEFNKQFTHIDVIHKNTVELKYQSTYNMVIDVRKLLCNIDKIVRVNFSHREKILNLQEEVEKNIQDMNLSN